MGGDYKKENREGCRTSGILLFAAERGRATCGKTGKVFGEFARVAVKSDKAKGGMSSFFSIFLEKRLKYSSSTGISLHLIKRGV